MLISKSKIIIGLFFLINYNFGMEYLKVCKPNNQESFEYNDFENILREKCKEIKTESLNVFEKNKNLEEAIIHENGHLYLNIIGNSFIVKNTESYIEKNKSILDEKTNIKLNTELNKINNKIKISQNINSKIIIEANIENNNFNFNSLINFNSNISGIVSENKYFKNKFDYLYNNEKGNDLKNSWNNLNEIFNDINKKRKENNKKELNYYEKTRILEALIDENIKFVESNEFKKLINDELAYFKNSYSDGIKNVFEKNNKYKKEIKEKKEFKLIKDGNDIITEINYNNESGEKLYNESGEKLFELFKNNINGNNKLSGFGINLNINGFYDNLSCIQKKIILFEFYENCEINREEFNKNCEINKKEFNEKYEINREEFNEKCEKNKKEYNEKYEINRKEFKEKCEINIKEFNKNCEINRKEFYEKYENNRNEFNEKYEMIKNEYDEKCEKNRKEYNENSEKNIEEFNKKREINRKLLN